MPSVNANKQFSLQFSRGMHMTTQIINKLVINLCLDVRTSSCKMCTICVSTQELAAPVGGASPYMKLFSENLENSADF